LEAINDVREGRVVIVEIRRHPRAVREQDCLKVIFRVNAS